jgi:hypothetical protein
VVAASLLAVWFVTLAIVGAVESYSPIPFWDMWSGYIGFFVNAGDGGWASWWKPHNEHRIVFSRLLFWLDLKFFHGTIAFLFVANLVLVALAAWLFVAMIRQAAPAPAHPAPGRIVGAAVVCLLFSWVQSENLGWGFQSAFFFAQLVPLFAFYLLYRAQVAPTRRHRLFVAAAVAGVACLGTMANGVLVLPLMVVLAVILKFDKTRIAILAVLAAAAALFYFSGVSPLRQRSGFEDVMANPLGLLHYTVLYLGSPFYYLSAGGRPAADLAGAFFLVGGACLFVRAFLRVRVAPTEPAGVVASALLVFAGYIVATAFITGYGRLILGVDQALSSRYTTAALMGWCALFVAGVSLARRDRIRWYVSAAAMLAVLLLVPRQTIVFTPNPYPFERLISGLALEMGVRDDEQVGKVAPRIEQARSLAEKARARGLSAYGRSPLQGIRERIGQQQVMLPAERCQTNIESIAPVPGDERYRSIEGWIYRPDTKSAPAEILLVDPEGRLVGYGFTGKWRPDVAKVLGNDQSHAGFRGYLLSSYAGERIVLVGAEPACQWEGSLPPVAGG